MDIPDNLVPFDPETMKPKDVGLGGPSTEYLVTQEAPDGKVWNIPSIWWTPDGEPVQVPEDVAARLAYQYEKQFEGRGQFPRFDDIDTAVENAKERSKSGGAEKSPLFQMFEEVK